MLSVGSLTVALIIEAYVSVCVNISLVQHSVFVLNVSVCVNISLVQHSVFVLSLLYIQLKNMLVVLRRNRSGQGGGGGGGRERGGRKLAFNGQPNVTLISGPFWGVQRRRRLSGAEREKRKEKNRDRTRQAETEFKHKSTFFKTVCS